jgi:hypothetical protein
MLDTMLSLMPLLHSDFSNHPEEGMETASRNTKNGLFILGWVRLMKLDVLPSLVPLLYSLTCLNSLRKESKYQVETR